METNTNHYLHNLPLLFNLSKSSRNWHYELRNTVGFLTLTSFLNLYLYYPILRLSTHDLN